jgi:outer membrane protein assembly factor BamB
MKYPALSLSCTLALLSLPALGAKKETKPEKAPSPAKAEAKGVSGWLDWRGPLQTGVSLEKGLPVKVDGKAPLWTADFPGQSIPVIANGKLYIMGYLGEGADLQEGVACFDAETGKMLWKQLFNDFLSDVVYLRYANSAPAIDAETGNVYAQNSSGIFAAFTADGKLLWKHSMMEEFGRMTFPNNRTASPLIDRELVITRGITAAWGAYGPPGDRFYAFDKKTGELVWSSAPGDLPQDNTFSHPWLGFLGDKRVLFSACGDSSLICLNARTGEPLYRTPVAKAGAKGGINAAVVQYKDNIIITHESENIDTSDVGRMAAFKIPTEIKPPTPPQTTQTFDTKELEQWRNPVGALACSPVLVGNRIYQVNGTGDLVAVNADDGTVLWKHKLGIEQRQSTPFYADGKLYIAMYVAASKADASGAGGNENVGDGELFVVTPGDKDCEILSRTILTGKCYGSPVGYNGKLYIQTEKKIYCFGKKGNNPGTAANLIAPEKWPAAGEKKKLQVIPYEVLLNPGGKQSFRLRALDANGYTVEENVDPKSVQWEPFIPPTALVKVTMKGSFVDGQLVAGPENVPSAGQFQASLGELKGYFKGRILPGLPLSQDFESYELNQDTSKPPPPAVPNTLEPPTAFAYPPLPWNAARFRWEVRDKDGNKALCKTIDNKRLQRGSIFINRADLKNYTIEADVLSEGNKRKMSEVGVINQRYLINLKGNAQALEVTSNQELFKQSVPFKWSPNEWYHLKARVDVAKDGSGVIRGKAWKKGDPEPDAWTIEVPHKLANDEGSPGLFGFSPQEQRAWIDNVVVTPNK